MSDLTVLELHFHDGPNVHADVPGLPFGDRAGKRRDAAESESPTRGVDSKDGGLASKIPIRAIAVVAVVVAIGAVVAMKLLAGDDIEDLADAFEE